jgi:polyhydroxybutyrate depolymerase
VAVYPATLEQQTWNPFPPGAARQQLPIPDETHRFGTGDDVSFLKAVVADLVQRGIADPKRIYLGGISFGGLMALRMVCVAPELFAAVGVIYSSMPEATGQACEPPKPLPLLVINGTADRVLPYAGGPTRAGFSVWSTDRTLSFFRTLNGCSDSAERFQLPDTGRSQTRVVLQRWTKCSRSPVVHYQIVGGGHAIRGSLNKGFVAFDALLSFFRTQTLDAR